jgi:hypothetical protein
MFEIKYDRDGVAIRDKAQIQQLDQQPVEPEPVEQEAAPEAEEVLNSQEGNPDRTILEPEPEQEQPEAPPAPKEPQYDPQASFRTLREAKLKAEAERDELMRKIAELEGRTKPAAPVQQEEEEELNLGADDLVEGKHISKIQKKSQSKIKQLEERLAKYEQQGLQERTELALKSKFQDFDKVVTPDNIAMLNEAYPEIARSLYTNEDLYTKAVSAYTLIKKFGIYQDSPFASEKAQVAKNVAKPRPVSSLSPQQGDGALSRANAFASGLTDDLKAQLLKEMQAARKGY